jgi:hypothetical protein
MHMKDAIKFALSISNEVVLSVIDEMSDAATTFPTPNGGCHPLWVLGHLTLVEGIIPAALFAEKDPAARVATVLWRELRTRRRCPRLSTLR